MKKNPKKTHTHNKMCNLFRINLGDEILIFSINKFQKKKIIKIKLKHEGKERMIDLG